MRMHRETLIKRLLNGCAATVLVLALSGGAAPLAEAAVSKSSVGHFEKAKSFVERGDINKAVIELKNAIQADGNNTDARVQLALIYMTQGNPAGAQKEFEAAMARGFDEAAIIPALAQTYTMQGKHAKLLEVYGDTVLEGKAQAALSVRRAQANLALKNYDAARAQLAQATAAAPDLGEIYIVKSWLLQAEGDFAGAESAIDRALALSDDGAEALMQKAELMRLQGDLLQAVDLATRSLDKNPYRREVLITRGLANAALNEVDAALEDAEVLIERNKADPFGAFLKAWGHSQKGETKVALAALAEGRGVESYAPALYLSAALHLKAGQLEQARQKINIFLSKAPTSTRGLVTSAAIHYQAGDFDAARDVLVPLYEADKNDVRVVTMLAYAYEQAGERGKAAALFDEATILDPANESLRFSSAEAKIGSGDIESALEELAGLADSATGGERAATLSFLTQLREKNYVGAEKAIDKLVSISGMTARTENFRASVALNKADLSGAEEHLKKSLSLDETYVPGRLNLARLLQLQKDAEGAKEQYQTLLKQTKGYLPAIDGLVKIAHGEVPELDGASKGHGGVGLGDGHLVVRVVDPAAAVIGFEEQFAVFE
jgi:putative PEP-CTERM system TPR-repeat lipoprotein